VSDYSIAMPQFVKQYKVKSSCRRQSRAERRMLSGDGEKRVVAVSVWLAVPITGISLPALLRAVLRWICVISRFGLDSGASPPIGAATKYDSYHASK
jgi:hypothetical protein